MPHILEKCLHSVYEKRGWDLNKGRHPDFLDKKGEVDETYYQTPEHYYCFPKLEDLKNEVHQHLENLGYHHELRDNIRTAIVVRLESLCVGAKGLMFNTNEFYSLEDLLNKNAVFELEGLADDDDKSFFLGLMLTLLSEYRQLSAPSINPGAKAKGLEHFLVIEEAHRLLKNVQTERSSEHLGNPKGKAVELFCNAIAEMRSLGQGVAVAEQIPTKISPDVIKNTNTKIVHRLVSKDDQALLAGSIGLTDDEALYMNRLKTGHALVHKEGMERPVECAVTRFDNDKPVSNKTLKRNSNLIKGFIGNGNNKNVGYNPLHSVEAYELTRTLGVEGDFLTSKFINSLCFIEYEQFDELKDHYLKEAEKILKQKNYRIEVPDIDKLDYLALSVLNLLYFGKYAKLVKPKTGFIEDFKELIIGKETDELRFNEFIENLRLIWEQPAQKVISKIVTDFSQIEQNRLQLDDKALIQKVNSFFLIRNEMIDSEVAKIIFSIKYDNEME